MPLLRRPLPFDDSDWIFELKLDGFRALAVLENGHAELLSRNGHAFASFSGLGKSIAAALPDPGKTVLDGEIVCLDESGKPQFYDLLFHRQAPSFFVFDLLISGGKDWRREQLMDRKQELRRLLSLVVTPP
jgi:bifunctional non-homologous end joining protein LigD